MSPQRVASGRVGRIRDTLVLLSPEQRVLRGLVLVTPPLAVLCAAGAGAGGLSVVLLLTVLCAVVGAALPDSHWPAVSLAAVGGYWLLFTPRELSAWSLLAAVLVLTCHCAAALSALGPPGMRLDQVTIRTWRRRVGAVLVGTAVVWLVAAAIDQVAGRGFVVLTAAALLLLAALVVAQD